MKLHISPAPNAVAAYLSLCDALTQNTNPGIPFFRMSLHHSRQLLSHNLHLTYLNILFFTLPHRMY